MASIALLVMFIFVGLMGVDQLMADGRLSREGAGNMMDLLSVRPDELRGVRMFSVAADRAELDRLQAILTEAEPGLAEGYLADILGAPAIDATRVEVFDLEDLSNFGLVNYLVKANGLPAEAVEPDRDRLEALSGRCVAALSLVPSGIRC